MMLRFPSVICTLWIDFFSLAIIKSHQQQAIHISESLVAL